MQTIKKYANRKLYHTNRKQYITLEGIAELIQAGEQVQVLNNETGEDITGPVLSQVVVQARGRSRLPMHVLTGLIQAGGDTLTGVRRTLLTTLGGSSAIDAEIKRRLDRLHEEGALSASELDRLRRLLLTETEAGASTDMAMLPSRSDLVRLNAQVDALAVAVEQLLAERSQPDHDHATDIQ